MGYLALGAMAGVGQEYLKQSGEERQNKFQEIRDRRLAELTTTENVRAEGVRAEEAKTERTFRAGESKADRESRAGESKADRESRERQAAADRKAKGPPVSTVAGGSEGWAWDEKTGKWEMYANPKKQHAPTAGSLDPENHSWTLRGSGEPTTYEQMVKDYELEYVDEVEDLLGQTKSRMKREGAPSLVEYINSRVQETVDVDSAKFYIHEPDKLWGFYTRQPQFKLPGGQQLAAEAMQKLHPGWSPPQGDPMDDPRTASPDPDTPRPDAGPGQGGYLSQTQTPAATSMPLNAGASTSNTPAPAPSTAQQLDSAKQQLAAVTAAIKQKREAGVPISGRVQERAQYMKLQNQIKELEAQLNTEGQQQASDQFEAARAGSGNSFLPTIQ